MWNNRHLSIARETTEALKEKLGQSTQGPPEIIKPYDGRDNGIPNLTNGQPNTQRMTYDPSYSKGYFRETVRFTFPDVPN